MRSKLPATASAAPIVGTLSEEAEELGDRSEAVSTDAGAVKALPLVRKLAREMGIDLAAVTASGADGRITREDVLAAAEGASASPEARARGQGAT